MTKEEFLKQFKYCLDNKKAVILLVAGPDGMYTTYPSENSENSENNEIFEFISELPFVGVVAEPDAEFKKWFEIYKTIEVIHQFNLEDGYCQIALFPECKIINNNNEQ